MFLSLAEMRDLGTPTDCEVHVLPPIEIITFHLTALSLRSERAALVRLKAVTMPKKTLKDGRQASRGLNLKGFAKSKLMNREKES